MQIWRVLIQRLKSYAGRHAWAFMLWNMRRLHEERTELKQGLRELQGVARLNGRVQAISDRSRHYRQGYFDHPGTPDDIEQYIAELEYCNDLGHKSINHLIGKLRDMEILTRKPRTRTKAVKAMWDAYARAHFKLEDTKITELEHAGMDAALTALMEILFPKGG